MLYYLGVSKNIEEAGRSVCYCCLMTVSSRIIDFGDSLNVIFKSALSIEISLNARGVFALV